MKKFLLLVLSLSVLAVLSACSDSGSSSNNGGSQTPTFDANSLVGTYDVVSFKTTTNLGGADITIATDCSGMPTGSCYPATMYGSKFTVSKVGDNLVAESQMQMYSTMMVASPNDVYQYILFSDMPVADFAQPATTTKTYTGVTGRNLTALTSNPEAQFSFTMNADGTITNNISLKKNIGDSGSTEAKTTVVLRKTSSNPETIDKNTLPMPADQITDGNGSHFKGFVENPAN